MIPIGKTGRFEKLIEKATCDSLVEPDFESIISACDLVRSREISTKFAVQCIKKRLQSDNHNIILHSLQVLESMMKNCGPSFHTEVANANIMPIMSGLIQLSPIVGSKILECLQSWACILRDNPDCVSIVETYEGLKNAGYRFPPLSESDVMFTATCAPSWKDGTACHRCKTPFSFMKRKHHCRNCGEIVCADCSNCRVHLPELGFESESRVCDHCHELLKKPSPKDALPLKVEVKDNKQEQAVLDKKRKEELEAQENEELQLALALSASEAECKNKGNVSKTQSAADRRTAEPVQLLPVLDTTGMDPELAQYLTKHYQKNGTAQENSGSSDKKNSQQYSSAEVSTTQPSAPIYAPVQNNVNGVSQANLSVECNDSSTITIDDPKQKEFVKNLRMTLDIFVSRLQSSSQRGRNITNDTSIQSLFFTLSQMFPQLTQYSQVAEEQRAHYEKIQDRLTQLRDAREALNSLRHEHMLRRQLEEQQAARARQLQMMQKLEAMRQQKQDDLTYRLRMALGQTLPYQNQTPPPQQQQQQQYNMPAQHVLSYPTDLNSNTNTQAIPAYPGNYMMINQAQQQTGVNYPNQDGVVQQSPTPISLNNCIYQSNGVANSTDNYVYSQTMQSHPVYNVANNQMIQQQQQPDYTDAQFPYDSNNRFEMCSLDAALPNTSQIRQSDSQTIYQSSNVYSNQQAQFANQNYLPDSSQQQQRQQLGYGNSPTRPYSATNPDPQLIKFD